TTARRSTAESASCAAKPAESCAPCCDTVPTGRAGVGATSVSARPTYCDTASKPACAAPWGGVGNWTPLGAASHLAPGAMRKDVGSCTAPMSTTAIGLVDQMNASPDWLPRSLTKYCM